MKDLVAQHSAETSCRSGKLLGRRRGAWGVGAERIEQVHQIARVDPGADDSLTRRRPSRGTGDLLAVLPEDPVDPVGVEQIRQVTKLHPLIQVVAREPIRIDAGAGRFEFDVADDQAAPGDGVVGPRVLGRSADLSSKDELRIAEVLRNRVDQHLNRPTQVVLERSAVVDPRQRGDVQPKVRIQTLCRLDRCRRFRSHGFNAVSGTTATPSSAW